MLNDDMQTILEHGEISLQNLVNRLLRHYEKCVIQAAIRNMLKSGKINVEHGIVTLLNLAEYPWYQLEKRMSEWPATTEFQ